jgi:DNA replication and repair protein RecF
MVQALRVAKLRTRGFRNLQPLELQPGPHFNVLYGDNGQGKSNLLEAIDYVGNLQSFRGALASDMIAREEDHAELAAEVHGDTLPHLYTVRLHRQGSREVELDGKRPKSRASYLGAIQTVLFHPGDLALVSGAPEQRRGYLDRILGHFDATYVATLSAYERALRSRNQLLRAERPVRKAITAYDELLASAGAVLGQARDRLVTELAPLVVDAFAEVTGEAQVLAMSYAPRVRPELAVLRDALEQSLEKDLARGFTAEGPHADELALTLDETPVKRFGSQGQQRAIVLALKIAELHELSLRVGSVPVLLLDDVSSELDPTRSRRLFRLLGELGGQVFLTTTRPELILIDRDREDFMVQSGSVRRAVSTP